MWPSNKTNDAMTAEAAKLHNELVNYGLRLSSSSGGGSTRGGEVATGWLSLEAASCCIAQPASLSELTLTLASLTGRFAPSLLMNLAQLAQSLVHLAGRPAGQSN